MINYFFHSSCDGYDEFMDVIVIPFRVASCTIVARLEKNAKFPRNLFKKKIANISLQKPNFPGMRFSNSTFFPCMHSGLHVLLDFTTN